MMRDARRRCAWRALLAAGAVIAAGALLATREIGAQWPTLEAQGGVALSTPLIVDGNGTRVRIGPEIVAGLAIGPPSWRIGPVRGTIEARAATSTLRLDDDGARWGGGRVWRGEIILAGRPSRASHLAPHAGVGLTWMGGGGEVRAFREIARRPRPVVEGGLVARRAPGSRSAISLVAQGVPITPSGGDSGGVLRVLVAVRHGW